MNRYARRGGGKCKGPTDWILRYVKTYLYLLPFLQDVINCIGGTQVLFPLLEQLSLNHSTQQGDMLREGRSPSKDIDCTDWVVVPSSSYAGKTVVPSSSYAGNFVNNDVHN